MPTTRGDGRVELHYVDSGPRNAEAIILIHGLGQQLVQWDVIGLTNRLLESGRRVVAYDQRDCGLSMRFETTELPSFGELQVRLERGQPVSLPYGLEDMVDDVFRVMDACGVESGTVVGHSLGGVVAALAALSRPDRFEGLVIISASLEKTERLGPRPPGEDGSHRRGVYSAVHARVHVRVCQLAPVGPVESDLPNARRRRRKGSPINDRAWI